jgi:CubicO group peptidase (beta-lactamase class C family)
MGVAIKAIRIALIGHTAGAAAAVPIMLLILTLALSATTVQAATEIINAKITKINPAERSIDVEVKGKSYSITLLVEPNAKLEIGGVRANMDDFKVDMQVTLIADIKAGKVTRMNAQGSKEPGRPTRKPKPTKTDAPPIEARGQLPDSLKSLDDITRSFLAEQEIRGAALVVVKDGKCVLARGYGFADKARKVPTEPTTLFPLDGVSKVITGIAVAQLAEQGKIDPNVKFFDALGTKPTDNEKDVPDNSRFVDATTIDLLKNPNRYQRDAFFKEYLEDSDFRKKINDRVKTMSDGSKIELRKFIKYDVVDLQYLLLARLVAKGTGKSYQEGVQETILAPLTISTAKVILLPLEDEDEERRPSTPVTTTEKTRKDRIQKRKDEEKEKIKKKADLYAGVAQAQFSAGKDYETTAMSLDGAGSWVASAIDLARLARSLDNPSETTPIKPEGMKILLAPVARQAAAEDDDADDTKAEKETPRETKVKSSRYFASGWWVVRPSSDDPEALFRARRSVHSGPVAICSEAGLHIVVAMTTGLTASRFGEEHPLIVELLDAASRIKDWPKDDLFGTGNTPEPEVAAEMAEQGNDSGSPDAPKRPRPRAPVIASIGDQVEATCRECMATYEKFLQAGGSKLLSEIQLSSAPDFKRISQRVPDGMAAGLSLRADYDKVLLAKAIGLSPLVPPDKPAQRAAVDAVMAYTESMSKFVIQLVDHLKNGSTPDQVGQAVSEIQSNEERMYADLFNALDKIDAAFPTEPKAASSLTELDRGMEHLDLRIKAVAQKLQSYTSARFGRIESIQSRAGGAPAEEQAKLPIMVTEVQVGATESAAKFTQYAGIASKYLELEKAAGSPYVPIWQATIDIAQAQANYANFLATFGKDTFKPDDESALLDKIDATKKARADIRAALETPADPPAEQAAKESAAAPAQPAASPPK